MKTNQPWIYQQEPAQPSPSLIGISSVLPYAKPNTSSSYMNPCLSKSSFAFPGFPISALPELWPVQANGGHQEVSPFLPSLQKNSLPISDPYLNEFHPPFTHGFGMNPTPNEVTGCTQKSFMIVDQSRDLTQVFFSTFNPTAVNHFIDTLNFPFARQLYGNPITQNLCNDNYIVREGSEVREDTEEINALLYSDDDDGEYDDNDNDDGEDDEVTSTCHSPFSLKINYDSIEEVEHNSADLAAYDDGSMKRQKLLDGGHEKSLVQAALNSAGHGKSYNQENDAKSCCVSASARTKRTKEKDTSSFQDKNQSRRDKIRKTLKILESSIPCSNHKDPLLIIEEAINHLKLLKLKAKALGVC